MDKSEKETHDFMNVESFSQLPFIRPAPSSAIKDKGIRLFGIQFGGNGNQNDTVSPPSDDSASAESNEDNNNNNNNNSSTTTNPKESESSETNRRFECHYCCRNFPTSQALGGHQNAHKRERQHAKRAHLQSAAMVHNSLSDATAHIYGLVNYRNPPSSTYPSWNISNPHNSRFYGGGGGGSLLSHHNSHHQHQQPINGSPLGLWRIPPSSTLHRDRSMLHHHPSPLFAGDDFKTAVVGGGGGGGGGSTLQGRYGYESSKASHVQDHHHLSLDLHL